MVIVSLLVDWRKLKIGSINISFSEGLFLEKCLSRNIINRMKKIFSYFFNLMIDKFIPGLGIKYKTRKIRSNINLHEFATPCGIFSSLFKNERILFDELI
jgi:hypothetical protein